MSVYYIWMYETLEVLEPVTEEEMRRLSGDAYVWMEKPCAVYNRACFRNHRAGVAWARRTIELLKKQFPERTYCFRGIRMLEDPMPPNILLTDD